MKVGDAVGVVIEEAFLAVSATTGFEVVSLEFSTLGLCFHEGRLRGRLFSRMSNRPLGSPFPSGYVAAERRVKLRQVLGGIESAGVFTEEELRGMVGKRLCVSVEVAEFRDKLHLRVVDFQPYGIGKDKGVYSDEEYVYMMRELQG